jgi:hypothetical protein
MPAPDRAEELEALIAHWRNHLHELGAAPNTDIAGLEAELREQIAHLAGTGLAPDEAFLIALKRIGNTGAASPNLAREHASYLWKQLAGVPPTPAGPDRRARPEALVALALAVAAAIAIKLPTLFGMQPDRDAGFYLRNASLFVLPFLVGYFAWKRRLDARTLRPIALAFVAAGLFANLYPFAPHAPGSPTHDPGYTEMLTALHLPIALWLVVGVAYAGGRWGRSSARMDFIRFSGELFIYYVLIALGGGVFTGSLALLFQAIGIDPEPFLQSWLLPCGAAGAVLVAAWLVEAKQGVIESIAPMLTRLFAPLFAALLVTFLATLLWTGRGLDIERGVLIGFDLLLVLVLALLLYSLSARDPRSPAGIFDGLQVLLLVSALLADLVALWAIGARISELGLTPNRVAALGENVILLVNLAWSAVLYTRFLLGRGSLDRLERWQTGYLPIYAAWAAIVVIVFPPLFKYI